MTGFVWESVLFMRVLHSACRVEMVSLQRVASVLPTQSNQIVSFDRISGMSLVVYIRADTAPPATRSTQTLRPDHRDPRG